MAPIHLSATWPVFSAAAAETTFYLLALYFGSVSVRNTRYAVTGGLIADVAGLAGGIFAGFLFFLYFVSVSFFISRSVFTGGLLVDVAGLSGGIVAGYLFFGVLRWCVVEVLGF